MVSLACGFSVFANLEIVTKKFYFPVPSFSLGSSLSDLHMCFFLILDGEDFWIIVFISLDLLGFFVKDIYKLFRWFLSHTCMATLLPNLGTIR